MLSSVNGMSYDCRCGFSSFSGSNRVAWMVMRFSANVYPLVGACLWLEVRDPDVAVLEPRPAPISLERDGVLHVLLVIALREVATGVGATRFLARERGDRDHL